MSDNPARGREYTTQIPSSPIAVSEFLADTVGDSAANVTITFHDNNGTQLGSTSIAVPGNGLAQVNNVIRAALGSAVVTGREGYLRLASDQPIIAWASKIENGFDTPGFQIGVGLPGKSCDDMDEKDDEIAHLSILARTANARNGVGISNSP